MNASDADPLLPEAGPAAPTDTAPVDKPKRRRAPRKTAVADLVAGDTATEPAEAVVSLDAPVAEADPAAAVDAPVSAPRRKRAPRRAAADPAVPTDEGPVASSGQGPRSDVDPQSPRVHADSGAGQPSALAGDAGLGGEGGEGGDGAQRVQGGDLEDGDDRGDSDPVGQPGDKPRRSRNRRRGRRGGERGRDAAADATPGEDAAADGTLAEPGEAAAQEPAPLAVEVFAEVLSGAFDAEPPASEDAAPAEPAAAPKRVLAAQADAPKLQKVLAQAGVGSRRDLEQMITAGRVTVNGQVAHTGQRISFGDRISVDAKPVRYRIAPPPPRVLAYHKPAGEVVTHDDPQQRPTVFRRLPRLPHGKWQSVGRLDLNTEGLLLFTNSGELANQLMHPRFGVEREYAVRSLGVLSSESKARLLEGLEIEGQRCGFKSIEDGGGEGVNHWYRVVITEGRNREVRKLFEAVGHAVSRLIRIRYGCVVLPRGLKRGVWVDLGEADVRDLRRLAAPVRPQGQAPAQGQPGPQGPNAHGAPADAEGDGPGGRRGRNRRGKGRGNERVMERGPDRGPDRAPDRAPDRGPRPNRAERPDRAPRVDRPPRGPRPEPGEGGAIPNPLQQTFDKRAIQQDRQQRREMPEDGPIPNPLQQTFDKRALQQARTQQREVPEDGPIPNPLQQTYDKRFTQTARGGAGRKGGDGDPEQIPDPMQTSMGYIGADAFRRKGGGGGGGRGGRRSGGGGGGGGGRPGGGGGGSGGGRPGGGGNRGPRRSR